MPPRTSAANTVPALAQHETLNEVNAEKPVHRVRFDKRTRIYLVLTLSGMSNDEYEATWVTDKESKENQAEIVETIKAMRLGNKAENICIRGLEHMRSAAHFEQRKINKDRVLRAVLDEQDRQWSAGEDNAEEIARFSARSSERARNSALGLGRFDAATARRIHAENGSGLSLLQKASDLSASRDNKVSTFTRTRR